MTDEFEIVDRYGARWRYKRAEGYSWMWAVDPNDHQRQERKTVEVYLNDAPEEYEPMLVAEFPAPAVVGDVTPNTCMNFNLRERPNDANRADLGRQGFISPQAVPRSARLAGWAEPNDKGKEHDKNQTKQAICDCPVQTSGSLQDPHSGGTRQVARTTGRGKFSSG